MYTFVCFDHSVANRVIGGVLISQDRHSYPEQVRNAQTDDFIKCGLIALLGKRYEFFQLLPRLLPIIRLFETQKGWRIK
jgi:hypothetical protein